MSSKSLNYSMYDDDQQSLKKKMDTLLNYNKKEADDLIKHLNDSSVQQEKNFWGEIASIICCDRSDVYLQSVIKKIRDHVNPESSENEKASEIQSSRRKKKRNRLRVSHSPRSTYRSTISAGLSSARSAKRDTLDTRSSGSPSFINKLGQVKPKKKTLRFRVDQVFGERSRKVSAGSTKVE